MAIRHRQHGVTLLELLITVVIGAILAASVVPNIILYVNKNRAIAQTNEVASAMKMARSEAVTRNASVTVCAAATANGNVCSSSGNDWGNGWVVFVDNTPFGTIDAATDTILRQFGQVQSATMTSTVPFVRFQASGFPAATLTIQQRATKCFTSTNRDISINTTGRTSYAYVACP